MDKIDERQCLDSLLNRLISIEYLSSLPAVKDDEKPDFILNDEIGVEVTVSTEQEYIRGGKLHDKEPFPRVAVTSNLVDKGRRRSNDEIRRAMFGSLSGFRDAVVVLEEWVSRASTALETKRKKLNKPGFSQFPKNWLLMYDRPPVHLDEATIGLGLSLIGDVLTSKIETGRDFDAVFLYSNRNLFYRDENGFRHNFKE